jgi:hypothetical protein
MLSRPNLAGFSLPLIAGAALAFTCCFAQVEGSTKEFRSKQASELVAEALQSEIYGLTAEREKLLEEANRLLPNFAPAMWHRGYINVDGRWVKVDEIGRQSDSNGKLETYEQIRSRTLDTVQGHMLMADWCRRMGLSAQERAHLSQVLDSDPGNTTAMTRLGFRRVNDRWISTEELHQANTASEKSKADFAKWSPEVTAIRQGLRHRSLLRQQAAIKRLSTIDSPTAIPVLESLLAKDSQEAAGHVLSVFDRIPDSRAALAVARLAVNSPWPEIRQQAANRLKSRDSEHFIPAMLEAMHSPITSRTLATRNSRGQLGLVQTLQREGQHENEQHVLSARNSRGISDGDVRLLNIQTGRLNQRISNALNIATNQSLSGSPQDWWNWWNEKNEVFVEGAKSTRVTGDASRPITLDADSNRSVTQLASVDPSRDLRDLERLRQQAELREQASRQQSLANRPRRRSDCLIAGTLIWTTSGPKAVEQIRAGDLVLSQDIETGELAFKPVLRTTVRPTTTLVRIDAVGQELQASGGHPFWISGEGWVKARDLRPGMELRTVDGTACVRRVEDGQQVQSFNLIVADFHSYFVGEAKILSHDNTVRRVTNAKVPGLLDQ